jgi:DNA uptake protein ComE-like DNA-binding protein
MQMPADNGCVRNSGKALLLALSLCLPITGHAVSSIWFEQSSIPPGAHIDINRANVDQLVKIPGLAPTWAARIVRFRPYRTKEDLLARGVLPSDVYDRIKDYVIAHRVSS